VVLQRDSGKSWVAGSSQAQALICTTRSGEKVRGRPGRERSSKPAIDRAKDRLAGPAEALARRLGALIQGRETQWPQTLVVRNADRFDLVSVVSVDWIEAANNYAVLHCVAVDHVFGETLASLETKLDPSKFLRVHRSTIVNVTRIVAVHTIIGGVYELELRGGVRIKTGRLYHDRIRKLLGA
jgi:two-component system LytT family response regulator